MRQFSSGHMGDLGVERDDTLYHLARPALMVLEWLLQNHQTIEEADATDLQSHDFPAAGGSMKM